MSSPVAGRRRGLPKRVRMRHDSHFVEELASRSEPPVGKMVALSSIEPDPAQPRSSIGELDELVESVREKGILEPILVRPNPQGGEAPPYRIISGERRFRAALEAGLVEIPAIEMDVDEQEALEIALVENLQRKDLTPFEEAEGYRVLAETHEYTHQQISRAVGKSRSAVTEALSLLQLSPRVRDAVQALGVNSKSILREVINAGGSDDETIRLLERVSTLGLSRADLRKEIKRTKKKPRRGRPKSYVFKFHAPDKRYQMALTFKQSEVDQDDLIGALEQILEELKQLQARDEGSLPGR